MNKLSTAERAAPAEMCVSTILAVSAVQR